MGKVPISKKYNFTITLQTGKCYRNINNRDDLEDNDEMRKRLFRMDYALLFVMQPKIYLHRKKMLWTVVLCCHFFPVFHLVPSVVAQEREKIKQSPYSGRG